MSFLKGLALGIVGAILWVFFSIISALIHSYVLTILMGLSFTMMFFGPLFFWIIIPLKNRLYEKRRKLFYVVLAPFLLILLFFLYISFQMEKRTKK